MQTNNANPTSPMRRSTAIAACELSEGKRFAAAPSFRKRSLGISTRSQASPDRSRASPLHQGASLAWVLHTRSVSLRATAHRDGTTCTTMAGLILQPAFPPAPRMVVRADRAVMLSPATRAPALEGTRAAGLRARGIPAAALRVIRVAEAIPVAERIRALRAAILGMAAELPIPPPVAAMVARRVAAILAAAAPEAETTAGAKATKMADAATTVTATMTIATTPQIPAGPITAITPIKTEGRATAAAGAIKAVAAMPVAEAKPIAAESNGDTDRRCSSFEAAHRAEPKVRVSKYRVRVFEHRH